ncbi:MAG: DUF4902 domain-containing protein [Pseudomonadota bacterium]
MNLGRVTTVIDFYVRLQAQKLRTTLLTHLESGVDTEDEDESSVRKFDSACALDSIRGFTEWVSQCEPAASVGWDWVLTGPEQLALDRNSIRTNVMLVDAQGVDCGQEATTRAVIRLIELTPWQPVVLQALREQRGPS